MAAPVLGRTRRYFGSPRMLAFLALFAGCLVHRTVGGPTETTIPISRHPLVNSSLQKKAAPQLSAPSAHSSSTRGLIGSGYVAYSFNRVQYPNWSFLRSISPSGEPLLASDRQPATGVPLSAGAVALLKIALNHATHRPIHATNFRPQHAILVFGKNHRLQRSIEICFGCLRAEECIAPNFQRQELVFDLRVAAHLFADARIPLSANGNSAEDFDKALSNSEGVSSRAIVLRPQLHDSRRTPVVMH